MKILIGRRRRLDEHKLPFFVFVLSLYITDKHVVTIGAPHIRYGKAQTLAKEICAESKGAITWENEPPERRFTCAGCRRDIPEDDLFYFEDEFIANTQDRYIRHYIYRMDQEPVECGPVVNYVGFLTDTEEEEKPATTPEPEPKPLPKAHESKFYNIAATEPEYVDIDDESEEPKDE